MELERIGFYNFFEKQTLQDGKGRVAAVYKDRYKIYYNNGISLMEIRGKMLLEKEFPAVGDWVEIDDKNNIINSIYMPKTKMSRKSAGKRYEEQIIVSNIDYIFIITSLNSDFNISRLERYLTIVYESGAIPVFILTKLDIAEEIEEKIEEIEKISFGVPIHKVSSLKNEGINELKKYFIGNKTVAVVGSSGVGKSTLINKLIGEEIIKTMEIREKDEKGKHTTTVREFYILQEGVIIDTPGMREIALWNSDISNSFEDIEELSKTCRFKNCTHETEPGCAVKEAVENGIISEKRVDNYKKMKREQQFIDDKKNFSLKQAEKNKVKNMMGSLNARKIIKKKI